ncbi:hypothetical protein ABZ769_35425 [Streptomyces olivoreticuli]
MLHIPVWVLLALVVILCVMFRAVQAWIVIVVLALGLYIADTQVGHETKKGGDQIVKNVNEHQK